MGEKASFTGRDGTLGDASKREEGGDADLVEVAGAIKWFDVAKGYGFIVPDDPTMTGMKDVLLHVTSLRQAGREGALEGAVIICDVIKRP